MEWEFSWGEQSSQRLHKRARGASCSARATNHARRQWKEGEELDVRTVSLTACLALCTAVVVLAHACVTVIVPTGFGARRCSQGQSRLPRKNMRRRRGQMEMKAEGRLLVAERSMLIRLDTWCQILVAIAHDGAHQVSCAMLR